MSYVDGDGETILETPEELERFKETTTCEFCRRDADEFLRIYRRHAVKQLVFSTTCEHG